jgi:hypothetical protein
MDAEEKRLRLQAIHDQRSALHRAVLDLTHDPAEKVVSIESKKRLLDVEDALSRLEEEFKKVSAAPVDQTK